jgi:ATP-dependent DNA helicase DinG
MASVDWLNDPAKGVARTVRQPQVSMAQIVEAVLTTDIDPEKGKPLIAFIEASTGVGKSFAYSIPAILSGKRVVISTAKKALQRQLIEKDLPFLVQKLGANVSFQLLKGKNNYACGLRVDELDDHDHLSSTDVETFREWFRTSTAGDLSERTHPRHLEILTHVQECVRKSCDKASVCGYVQARNQAMEAKILVVNHALLATDLAMGGGKVLGPYDALIIDEGHQAGKYFRDAFTLRMHHKHPEALKRIFGRTEFDRSELLEPMYDRLFKALPPRSEVLKLDDNLRRIFLDLYDLLNQIRKLLKARNILVDEGSEPEEDASDSIVARALSKLRAGAQLVDKTCRLIEIVVGSHAQRDAEGNVEAGDPTEYVCCVEQRGQELPEVFATPIECGPLVAPALLGIKRVVVTSATLATANGMEYAAREFGLSTRQIAVQQVLPSPFNYPNLATAYIPDKMPDPSAAARTDDYYDKLVTEMHSLLVASQGGALVLCTSYKDMKQFYDVLREKYAPLPYNIGYQQGPPEPLLDWFKRTPRAVLFAVKTFWEGVDVPGLGLRLVIVPKLPFPPFGDPVLQARKKLVGDRMLEAGYDPKRIGAETWMAFDFEEAMMDLKQGVGRLIRSETDMGVVAILDQRVYGKTKGYSPKIRKLLPMPITDQKAGVVNFLSVLGKRHLAGG